MDLGLLPLAFSLILTIASRLLHPYSTDGKTSRLMMKSFSTVRDTQRDSQSYMEKRRGRKEIEVTRRRRGAISSLSVLYSPEHPERFTDLSREEKEEEGDRGDQEEKRSNQFPKCSLQPGTPREIHRLK